MTTAERVLSTLTARGVRLLPDGDGLIAEPASRLTPAAREAIRACKTELLAYLRAAQDRPAAEAPKPERNRWPGR